MHRVQSFSFCSIDLFCVVRCQLTTLLMAQYPNIVTKVTFKFGLPLFHLPAHEKCCIQVTVVPWLAAFSDRQGRCWWCWWLLSTVFTSKWWNSMMLLVRQLELVNLLLCLQTKLQLQWFADSWWTPCAPWRATNSCIEVASRFTRHMGSQRKSYGSFPESWGSWGT